jgi:mutator protein MutT
MIKGIDYIGTGVGAVIVKDGKMLIQKRGKEAKNDRGKWEIPGGAIEWGEEHKEALKREVLEETGVEIEVVELVNIHDNIVFEDKQHWIAPTYLCKLIKGTPKIMEPHKCEEMGWFTLEEAESLDLAMITRQDIDFLKKKFPKGLPKSL